jgi:Domain of unknown function (DUF4111)/Nucleotidyltransferase domain
MTLERGAKTIGEDTAMTAPTGYRDLDRLLVEFVKEVRAALREDVVGIYLQGSFALGAADEWSDVDFIVAVRAPVVDLTPLNAIHERLYQQPVGWAKHLEGSYIPIALLRQIDPERTPLPYLDNGATRLELDPHCNSALVRWILRNHGISLYGPHPSILIDPVAGTDQRIEAQEMLVEYLDWGASLSTMSAWEQPYLVLTISRLLHTIESGEITSKAEAATSTIARLPEWAPLVEQALADRPNPWTRVHQPADPAAAAATRHFIHAIRTRFLQTQPPI